MIQIIDLNYRQLPQWLRRGQRLIATVLVIFLAGCTSTVVKTTAVTPLHQETREIPEHLLLDVGVIPLDPGIDNIADQKDTVVFPEIRKAESRFMAHQLVKALQTSAAWGAVRMIPNDSAAVDVIVNGKILQSDGELLIVDIDVRDASGKHWFTQNYKELASRYAYDPKQIPKKEPFQGLYNRIANDIYEYQKKLKESEISNIRTISELKFAESFSPEAFSEHIDVNKKGIYEIKRLPAENDPMFQRIRKIRERDYLYIDTLQEYYNTFSQEMSSPYLEWRGQSYDEVITLRDMKRSSRQRTIAGIAAVVGGVLAAGSNNGASRAAGQVAVVGGGYLIKSGFDKNAESKMHAEALLELGSSLEANIEPRIIELEDRTITLSGTVENQYEQWRKILLEIYKIDTGQE